MLEAFKRRAFVTLALVTLVACGDDDGGTDSGTDAGVTDGGRGIGDANARDAGVDASSPCGNGTVDTGETCDPALDPCCNATCDGPASTRVECRASVGGCDLVEFCDGTSTTCPADSIEPAGTICRPMAGACDPPETCDGVTPACPVDAVSPSTTECRPAGGLCDVPENCDGTGVACPPDSFAASAVECRAAAGPCDRAESCTGSSPSCPPDAVEAATSVCRPSAGPCDSAELCDGTTMACPADTFESSGTTCRAAADICDAPETCTGGIATCPADAFVPASTVCRAATGACDLAEACSGTSSACPADMLATSSTVCRPAADVCDQVETCSGISSGCPADSLMSASTVCRPATGDCDVAELCTGSVASCPANGFRSDTTVCTDCPGTAPTCLGCASGMCLDIPRYAVRIPNAGARVLVSDTSGLFPTTFTYEIWVSFDSFASTNPGQFLFVTEGTAGWDVLYLRVFNGNLECVVGDGSGPNILATPASAISTGVWHHIACQRNASSWSLWLDGSSVASAAASGYLPPTVGAALGIGGDYRTPPQSFGFRGRIDEARISSVARYTSTFTPVRRFAADASTRALWHFDEGTGTTAADATSATAHVGLLDRGAVWVAE